VPVRHRRHVPRRVIGIRQRLVVVVGQRCQTVAQIERLSEPGLARPVHKTRHSALIRSLISRKCVIARPDPILGTNS
jgi:hypothetical protein